MYTIKADGKLLYSPELVDDGYKVISPKLHLEINAVGNLEFTLPPCNHLYDEVHKMKSIITVEQDGEEIFRGRVTEETVDNYRQRILYCEGDLSFLLDSLQEPFTFKGTQAGLFEMLLNAHNAQMDENKRFTIGNTSGLDDEEEIEVGVTSYADTLATIQAVLLDVYGGYIQTRREADVYCIDYLDAYSNECSQKIEFGVNLLDFESQMNGQELCTVLVPLGANTTEGKALTIASVNDGKIYLENTQAIERYGRIYRTYTWDQVTDPAQLLELGDEYLMSATMPETLTIRAVDMHLIDAEVEKIRKGDFVQLKSKPHGLDRSIICAVIDADLDNGDQTVFTFGLPVKTMASQAVATAERLDRVSNSVNDQHIWLTETDKGLNIAVNNIDLIGHRVSQAEIDVKSNEIELKAAQASVDVLGERMTSAEVRIDGAESAIELKADLILLDGYVKADELFSEYINGADIDANSLVAHGIGADSISGDDVWGDSVRTSDLQVGGTGANWKEQYVVTSVTLNKQHAAVPIIGIMDGNAYVAGSADCLTLNTSLSYSGTTIKYLGA